VEEVSAADDDNDASPLGSLQKGTIDLTGVTVGQHNLHVLENLYGKGSMV